MQHLKIFRNFNLTQQKMQLDKTSNLVSKTSCILTRLRHQVSYHLTHKAWPKNRLILQINKINQIVKALRKKFNWFRHINSTRRGLRSRHRPIRRVACNQDQSISMRGHSNSYWLHITIMVPHGMVTNNHLIRIQILL